MGDLSEHFDSDEFRCHHCGALPPGGIAPKLIQRLEALRRALGGREIVISSGYRCPEHNRQLRAHGHGTARRSQHLYGKAADVVVPGVPPAVVAERAEAVFGFVSGIGRYRGFTHLDVRMWHARWGQTQAE